MLQNTYPSVARHCAECGAERLANAKFCHECGTLFPQEPQAGPESNPAPVEQTSTPPTPPNNLSRATTNAEPAPEISPVPPSIPHEFGTAEQAGCRTCSSCGQDLPQEAVFCSACGTSVADNQDVCLQLVRIGPNPKHDTPVPVVKDILKIGNAADCDIRLLDDAYVSRSHAQLLIRDGKVFVEDLGSSNGTFVRVNHPMELELGNKLVVGTTVLWLEETNRS